jgi:hypothetical protein
MLMFALSIVVIEWADCSRPAFRLGRSASLVAASKEWESDRPPMRNDLAPSLPKLTDDERDVILASGVPWAAWSGSISVPLVEVLDKDAMCTLFHPGGCPHHKGQAIVMALQAFSPERPRNGLWMLQLDIPGNRNALY